MESLKLEIILHSAKDLFDVKTFGTMDPYAIVGIIGDGKVLEALPTGVATNGGCSPIWNSPMQFNLHKNSHTLFCVIRHDGTLFDRDIGYVLVPVADLLAGNGSGEKRSYPVKIIDSKEVYGEIILSHKFSIKKNGDSPSGVKVDGGPSNNVKGKKHGETMKQIAISVTSGLIVALLT